MSMRIDLCMSAPQFKAYFDRENPQIVLVVDTLRASSTICSALQNGAKEIIIVAELEEAIEYRKRGYMVGAERHAKRCDFAQLGNSPFDYDRKTVEGKTIVFTTTNGTKCVDTAFRAGASDVFICGYINLPVTVSYLSKHTDQNVLILAAGWNDTVGSEDCLYAGALISALCSASIEANYGDSARMMKELWSIVAPSPTAFLSYVHTIEHYRRMREAGVDGDIPYCLEEQIDAVLPIVYQNNSKYVCKAWSDPLEGESEQ